MKTIKSLSFLLTVINANYVLFNEIYTAEMSLK